MRKQEVGVMLVSVYGLQRRCMVGRLETDLNVQEWLTVDYT